MNDPIKIPRDLDYYRGILSALVYHQPSYDFLEWMLYEEVGEEDLRDVISWQEPDLLHQEILTFIKYGELSNSIHLLEEIINGNCVLSKIVRMRDVPIPYQIFDKLCNSNKKIQIYQTMLTQLRLDYANYDMRSLETIPSEILDIVISGLDIHTMLTLRITSTTMNKKIVPNDRFWNKLDCITKKPNNSYGLYTRLTLIGNYMIHEIVDDFKIVKPNHKAKDDLFLAGSIFLVGSAWYGITSVMTPFITGIALFTSTAGLVTFGAVTGLLVVIPFAIMVGTTITYIKTTNPWGKFKEMLAEMVIKPKLLEFNGKTI
jgi:hypothetical protein